MQFDYDILHSVHKDAEKLRLEAQRVDFVLNHNGTAGSSYVVPVPKGANRVEILAKVVSGAAGNLLVFRQVSKVTDPSGFGFQVIAATLVFNTNGTRQVLELPPDVGTLFATEVGLPVGAQMNAICTFWREG